MKNILVILEQECEPKLAFAKALEIAQRHHAKLHVIACCIHQQSWMNAVVGMTPMREIKERMMTHTRNWVSEYINEQEADTEVTYEVVWSENFIESVITVAEQQHSDLIVKTGRRSEALFHTPSDYKLLRDSKIPVYIVVEHSNRQRGDTVVVALDLLSEKQTKQLLNRKMLTLACDIAKRNGFTIQCCYSVDVPVILRDLDLINEQEFIEKNTCKAQKVGAALLAEYGLPDSALTIGSGAPYKIIDATTHKTNARWIMVGSVSNRSLTSGLIGNRSEQLLTNSKYDLLVVSPD